MESPQCTVTILLMGIGALLRVWQYLANTSLWIDEAALARNIIDRPASALLGGLDYAQVAPVGFLLVQKAIVALFGTSEFALRAFPLSCGLLSLLLFWMVARRIVVEWAVPFAVGLFSLGMPLIYFSSQVKQYSSDVAVAILMLLGAVEIRHRGVTLRRAGWLGVIGAIVVWFSQPAVFVLSGLGATLAYVTWSEGDRPAARRLMITGSLWALSAAAATVHALRTVNIDDREYFRWFWADGFMPLPPQVPSDLLWVLKKLTWAFGGFASGLGRTHGGLNYRWSWVFTLVMLIGLWGLWKKRQDLALFLTLPIVLVVAASGLRQYPFTARLFLFLMPSLLLATAAGATQLFSSWPRRLQVLMPFVLAVLGGAPIYAAVTALPPNRMQHLRPIIEDAASHRLSGDRFYVYYGAGQAFRYYAERLSFSLEDVVFGSCAAGNPRRYLEELDQMRGYSRVWVIVSHAMRDGAEAELLLNYLDRIGHRLKAMSFPGSSGTAMDAAHGYLFDLSDRSRLASESAGTLPIPPSLQRASVIRWDCWGVGLSESARSAR